PVLWAVHRKLIEPTWDGGGHPASSDNRRDVDQTPDSNQGFGVLDGGLEHTSVEGVSAESMVENSKNGESLVVLVADQARAEVDVGLADRHHVEDVLEGDLRVDMNSEVVEADRPHLSFGTKSPVVASITGENFES